MTITTSKDVEGKAEPVAAKQPGFMTYEEAELQMKHGHSIRRASWPMDMHLTDGKIVGGDALAVDDDPNHDPADSNPDETRKLRRAAELATGKEPAKKKAPEKPEARKVEKEDKAANDWTFYFPRV